MKYEDIISHEKFNWSKERKKVSKSFDIVCNSMDKKCTNENKDKFLRAFEKRYKKKGNKLFFLRDEVNFLTTNLEAEDSILKYQK